jgi:hypothetical protein
MTRKQKYVYGFIKTTGSKTIREVIDYCKESSLFSGYVPEGAKQVYCSLIDKGYIERTERILKIKLLIKDLFD